MNSDAFNFWKHKLNGAKYIAAPMVDQSELAFRMLVRKYGAQLCYTPMINAHVFLKDQKYRKENLVTNQYDRPLIVQFCSNDPKVLLEAAKLAAPFCDAIDLNLGCPQAIAKRGHYGAFLQDEWDLIYDMINIIHKQLDIPITCKIRIFPEIEKTVSYAKMLESAGASLICVHGRTREQKGSLTGLASWAQIKAVKQAVQVPVLANGNIQMFENIESCYTETGVDGVMAAEGLLHNPALFTGKHLPVWILALEYLEMAKKYPCSLSHSRGHLFKILHHCFMLSENEQLRETIAKGQSLEEFEKVIIKVKEKYEKEYSSLELESEKKNYPPFICQPYYRPPPSQNCQKESNLSNDTENDQNKELKISKRQLKRLKRRPNLLTVKKEHKNKSCSLCPNRKGDNCDYELCRPCCKKKAILEILDCKGHKLLIKTKKNSLSNTLNNFK